MAFAIKLGLRKLELRLLRLTGAVPESGKASEGCSRVGIDEDTLWGHRPTHPDIWEGFGTLQRSPRRGTLKYPF